MGTQVPIDSDSAATAAPPMAAKPIADTGEAIAALLLSKALINDKQLTHARRVRAKLAQQKSLLNTMLDLEFFTPAQLNEVLKEGKLSIRLGDQLGYLHVEPDYNSIDKLLLDSAYLQTCEQYHFIPVRSNGDSVIVACTDPNNREIRTLAQGLLGVPVELAICSQFALQTALHKFRTNSGPRANKVNNDDSLAMKVVDETLQAAIAMRASDIHFESRSNKMRIRFRTDSMLWQFKEITTELAISVIARLKILSKANIAERRRHQDGKIEYTDPVSGQIVDVRCSFYISVHGEKACLRLLNRRTELLNIETIGMTPAVLERFKYEALEAPSGVVMITGPTGSGKTTTLYSCVDYLNNDDTSIITAEEPVEYVIDGVTQCSLNPKIDMTFAETLRHMVRQDPDVIVLGEIRDQESAEAAIQSALTGHKVLTTFHTEDTIGGLLRLMNMNIETFLISSTVVSVLAQRLLKRVCTRCAVPHKPTPLEMQRAGLRSDDLRIATFLHGKGCEACKFTGYSGRVSVFELLVLDEKVKEAILNRKASYDIRRISIECSGLITLLEDGLEKAARGLTTIAEVLRMLPRNEKPRSLAEIRRVSRSTDV
jgi:type IV pilus assembly protein PilB